MLSMRQHLVSYLFCFVLTAASNRLWTFYVRDSVPSHTDTLLQPWYTTTIDYFRHLEASIAYTASSSLSLPARWAAWVSSLPPMCCFSEVREYE